MVDFGLFLGPFERMRNSKGDFLVNYVKVVLTRASIEQALVKIYIDGRVSTWK